MTAHKAPSRLGRLTLSFEQAMTPIFTFALLNAAMCWTAALVFRDTYEFAVVLLGLGCFPIIVAVCAYLLVLINRVEREG